MNWSDWCSIAMGIIAYLLGGVATFSLMLNVADNSAKRTMTAGELYGLCAAVVLLWPMFSVVMGYMVTTQTAAGLLRLRRERKIAELQRAAAMQYRDVGTLDELDRD